MVILGKILLDLIIYSWKLTRETWWDENEQSAVFSGVVPDLIFVLPESILNISPLPLVGLVFVLGCTVVLFWRMPGETPMQQFCVQPETEWELKRGVSPSFPSLCSRKSLQGSALEHQEGTTSQAAAGPLAGVEGPTHSPSSEQARVPTMWHGDALEGC